MSESSLTTVAHSNAQKHSFKWTIVNFSKIREQYVHVDIYDRLGTKIPNARQDSPLNSTVIKIKSSTWKLYVYPKYYGEYDMVYALINEIRDSTVYEAKTRISLIDSAGEMVHISAFTSSTTLSHKIPSQSLFDEKDKFLPNDTLTIKCEFEVLYKYTITNFEAENESTLNNPNSNIFSDLMSLLDTQTCSDVTLRCRDSEFPAHKLILSARSPVFFNMFQHDMLENRMNLVEIPDIKSSTMKELLHYIYGKEIGDSLPADTCFELYEAADKYQLLQLMQHCASIMARNLSMDTVCEVAVLADVHDDPDLFLAAKSFVKNYAFGSQLFISKTWFDFVQKSPGTASLLIAP